MRVQVPQLPSHKVLFSQAFTGLCFSLFVCSSSISCHGGTGAPPAQQGAPRYRLGRQSRRGKVSLQARKDPWGLNWQLSRHGTIACRLWGSHWDRGRQQARLTDDPTGSHGWRSRPPSWPGSNRLFCRHRSQRIIWFLLNDTLLELY